MHWTVPTSKDLTNLREQLRNHFTEEGIIDKGAIFAAVTKDDMPSIELLFSLELPVITAINHVAAVHSKITAHSSQNTNLRRTRDLLLPRLLSGQMNLWNKKVENA
jgi:type I restriction enzyme S subunit